MNKKIITVLLVTTGIMSAKPYAGFKLGFSKTQLNTKLSGIDVDGNNNDASVPFSRNKKMSISSLTFGLLVGTTFKLNDKTSAFIEGDWEYLGGKTSKANMDLTENSSDLADVLQNENVTIRARNSFGFMPGVNFAFNEKVSGLFGLRFNMTQFRVSAIHVNSDGHLNLDNRKAQSKFLFGVEPTVGAAYKINDKIGARLTVGYNFMKNKKIIADYTNGPNMEGVNPDVSIKPRGFNVRLTTTYSF